MCYSGKAAGIFSEMQRAYPPNLSSFFCSGECPCRANKTSFPATAEYSSADMRPQGAVTVMNCPKSPYTSPVRSAILGFLGILEEEFKCSGLCKKEKWYYFSDVNLGPPETMCQEKILEYIDCT